MFWILLNATNTTQYYINSTFPILFWIAHFGPQYYLILPKWQHSQYSNGASTTQCYPILPIILNTFRGPSDPELSVHADAPTWTTQRTGRTVLLEDRARIRQSGANMERRRSVHLLIDSWQALLWERREHMSFDIWTSSCFVLTTQLVVWLFLVQSVQCKYAVILQGSQTEY